MNSKKIVHLPKSNVGNENPLSFGEVIQKYRNLANLNQAELADLVGVSRATVNNWENNKTRPDPVAVKNLAELIGLPLYELFGVSHAPLPSNQENRMLNLYRQLSNVGRRIAYNMIGNMVKEEANEQLSIIKDSFSLRPLISTPAAARNGLSFSDIGAKPFFFRQNRFNQSCDKIIKVSGDSMLPDYHDGDYVYVKDAEWANNDDIVIAAYHEELVIKRYDKGRLYSLNDALPFGEKSEDDNIHIIGVVIGIVEQDELPSEDEKKLLPDVFYQELKKFWESPVE